MYVIENKNYEKKLSQQFLKTLRARRSEIIRAGTYVSNTKYFLRLLSWGLNNSNSIITHFFTKDYCDVIKTRPPVFKKTAPPRGVNCLYSCSAPRNASESTVLF